MKLEHDMHFAQFQTVSGDASGVFLLIIFLALLGSMIIPILTSLLSLSRLLLWHIPVVVMTIIRDELIWAILVALASSTGIAGLIHLFFS